MNKKSKGKERKRLTKSEMIKRIEKFFNERPSNIYNYKQVSRGIDAKPNPKNAKLPVSCNRCAATSSCANPTRDATAAIRKRTCARGLSREKGTAGILSSRKGEANRLP